MAKAHRRKLKIIGRSAAITAEERLRLILDERTENLAARLDRAAQTETVTQRVLICLAGRERFGIPIEQVSEVLPFRPCVPGSSAIPALVGHFGRAGHLVSVIDLGIALGLGRPDANEDGHFVVLKRTHPHVALRVDRAQDVASVTPLRDESGSDIRSDVITGLALAGFDTPDQSETVSVLDTERLLKPFLMPSSASGA